MRRIAVLFMAAALLCVTGCGKFTQIKVNSAKIENVSPNGLRGLNADLAVEIDNPAIQIKLSDMKAELKYSGKVLGNVTVDPFTMKGRTAHTYHLKAKVKLDEDVSLYDMLMFLDKDYMDKCKVDITVKGKLRGGLSKTMTKKDIPLKKLLKYADKK